MKHNDTQHEREKAVEQASESRVMLTGYMDVPSERLNAVKDALIEHINLTRAEKGCILFEVREDDAHPGRLCGCRAECKDILNLFEHVIECALVSGL